MTKAGTRNVRGSSECDGRARSQRWRGLRRFTSVACFGLCLGTPLACWPIELCGDGMVTGGEACDDGNADDGDGCSASCELDDDIGTPGDERAGFMTCTNAETSVSVTCGPGLGCCRGGPSCAETLDACASPFEFSSCDGPEDCGTGEQCWLDRSYVGCSSTPTPYFFVFCHTDDDCIQPARNPCENGTCFGDEANVPATRNDGPAR
jgi:cysteine-rich repeat protein